MTLRSVSYHVSENGPTVSLLEVVGFEINGYVIDLNSLVIANVEATFQDDMVNLLAGINGEDVVGHAQVMNTNFISGYPTLTINHAVSEFTTFDECHASGSVVVG